MRNLLIGFVVIFALGANLYAAKASTSGEQEENKKSEPAATLANENEKVRADFKLPEIFKFERFKSLYRKRYRSTVEELLRLKVFLARSYQVFLSAVAYKYRIKSYYLKLGERTDFLPEELEAMRNKHTASRVRNSGRKVQEVVDEDLELIEPEELESELGKIRERAKHDPDYEKLALELNKLTADEATAGPRRRRRSVESGETSNGRADFSVGQAFAAVSHDSDSPSYEDSQTEPPVSNNLLWEQPEFDTAGVRDYENEADFKEMVVRQIQHTNYQRTYNDLPVKSQHHLISRVSLLTQVFMSDEKRARMSSLRVAKLREINKGADDVVWVDHRNGGCMQPIQNQGLCGSCYAFSTMAYLEWLHCMETTERVKFSEQYLVDCGPAGLADMHACSGANYYQVSRFVTNFGLELAGHYPYFGYQSQCPYAPREEKHKMGYLRADVSDVLLIELKYAEKYLDRSPLLVDIITTKDFVYYGGGVYDGKDCVKKTETDHSVLMIGHGREDGEEYWLLRNSHGRGWGEEGYMKLNKNSKCIVPPEAAIYKSTDGHLVPLSATRNDQLAGPVKLRPKPKPVLALLSKVAMGS